MKPLVVANWKMHGTMRSLRDLSVLRGAATDADLDVTVAPPFTLLADVARNADGLGVAGQDCHAKSNGPHTGSVSAAMLKEAGASAVILGHSERRDAHGESDAMVAAKAAAATAEGLLPIICIGETADQRAGGEYLGALRAQLSASLPDSIGTGVIAYEPVWAIGSGRTPTPQEIGEVVGVIGEVLCDRAAPRASWRILYGGSVSGGNAAMLAGIDQVDGFLVGGASLRTEDFVPIITAVGQARSDRPRPDNNKREDGGRG